MAQARVEETAEETLERSALEAEVRELVSGWRARRLSTYEPCAAHNVAPCLVALQEEFSQLNLKYIFNPYTDVCVVGEGESLQPRALVDLVNAAWTLLQHQKRLADTSEKLAQQNHILQQNNTFLNGKLERLGAEAGRREREARACVSEGARAAEQATGASAELRAARARLALLARRGAATEHALRVDNNRLKQLNRQQLDRCRDKGGALPSSSSEAAPAPLRARELALQRTVGALQLNNRQLLEEVLSLRAELLADSLGRVGLHHEPAARHTS